MRQQQIYLVAQTPVMMVLTLINASIVTFVLLGTVPTYIIGTWYLIFLGISAAQLTGWYRIHAAPPPSAVTGKTLQRAETRALLLGALWGSLILIAIDESIQHQMFVAVVLAGVASGTASILNPLPKLNARFLVACLSPVVIVFLIERETFQLTIAALAIVLGGALLSGSRRGYRQFAEMIRSSYMLQQTKADLLDAIESTGDAFALFDRSGRLALANCHYRDWFPEGSDQISDLPGEEIRKVAGGRWVQSVSRPTSRGGVVSVHTDITQLKDRESELLAAKQAAEEANHAKSEFLANMSHELRTPLNAIIGFSDMMIAEMFGPMGSAKYEEYARDINYSASHLLSIITDILDLSKIESAKYKLDIGVVDVAETIKWVVSLSEHNATSDRRRPIAVSISEDFGPLHCDQRAMKQILLNLLNNALKFTPDTGSIGIIAEVSPAGEPKITVWDTGIGIPAEKLSWVRQPFHQVEGAFQKKYHGTGLGLSISDALIQLHGGHLEIESEVDVGTSVAIVFPPESRVKETGIPQNRNAARSANG
ncbi:MAG: hypothetical protein HXY22_12970 [Alphaproteobacteria bacterium]|nr:hypothetical protein [Alphaproteobacteria bacterium]